MARLGELVISLRGEIAKFEASMKRAESITQSVAGSINNQASAVNRTLGALGVGLSFAGLAMFTKAVIDSGDALDELSQKVGVTVEDLSALKYAFEKDGVQVDALATGMKKLSQQIVSASDVSSKQARIFSAMGVDISKGIQPALEQIADKFRSMPDGPTKAALAVELFGKAGMDMIPTLNQGSAELRRMRGEAEALGLVMSGETAKAMAEFNDNMKAVKGSAQGLVVEVFNKLTPSIMRVTNAMKEAAKESGILKAIWVLMGGVAAEAMGLNDTELQKLQKHLNGLHAQLQEVGQAIPDDREEKLRKGLIEPATIAEGQYKRLLVQMRLTQSVIDSMQGKYDDQVSRRARQGQRNVAPEGGTPGTNSALADRLKGLMGGGSEQMDFYARQVAAATSAIQQAEMATKLWAAGHDKLTASQAALIKLQNDPEFKKLPDKQQKHLASLLKTASAQEEYNRDLVEAAKWTKELVEWNQRLQDEVDGIVESYERIGTDRLRALQDEVDMTRHEVSLIGQSAQARELANLAMREELALRGVINEETRRGIQLKFEELRQLAVQRQQTEESLSIWNQVADRGASMFADLAMNGRRAFDSLKQSLKSFAQDLIALFARKWILQLGGSMVGGNVGQAMLTQAGQVGQGTIGGSVMNTIGSFGSSALGWVGSGIAGLGTSLFGASSAVTGLGLGMSAAGSMGMFSAFSTGLSGLATGALSTSMALGMMVPVVGIAIAAIAGLAAAFKDAGENWKGQLGFGANATAYASNSVFGTQGFSNLQGRDELNSQIQAWMAGTAGLDTMLARGLTSAQIESIKGTLASTPTREFAFPEGDETAAEQLTLNFLQTKYGAIFDQIDTKFAAFIRGYKGKAEDLLKEIGAFATVIDSLGGMGIKGFNLGSLRAMSREGEETQQTLQRVATEWQNFNALFTTEAEALEQARSKINSTFAELGLAVPASVEEFEALVRGIDTSTEAGARMVARLLDIDDAFVAVANSQTAAAERAREAAREAQESWKGFRDLLVRAAGRHGTTLQANFIQGDIQRDADAFRAANAWARTLNNMELFNQLLTMQAGDWANYSEANRALIQSIVGSTLALQDLTDAAVEFSGTYGMNAEAVRRARELERQQEEAKRFKETQDSLREWWTQSLQSDLSPLSRSQKTANAKAEYERILALAKGGDITAMSQLGAASTAYLEAVRKQFKSSGAYNEVWREVMTQTGMVAGVQDVNAKLANALPANHKLASQADVAALDGTVRLLIDTIKLGISVNDPDVANALRELARKMPASSGAFAV